MYGAAELPMIPAPPSAVFEAAEKLLFSIITTNTWS